MHKKFTFKEILLGVTNRWKCEDICIDMDDNKRNKSNNLKLNLKGSLNDFYLTENTR